MEDLSGRGQAYDVVQPWSVGIGTDIPPEHCHFRGDQGGMDDRSLWML